MPLEIQEELLSCIFSKFVTESLPECGYCPYNRECFRPFALLETGEIKPWSEHMSGLSWARWSKCPRMVTAHAYAYDQEQTTIEEQLRWGLELGHHRHAELSAGASMLYRHYSLLKDASKQLREHIYYKSIEDKRGRGGKR